MLQDIFFDVRQALLIADTPEAEMAAAKQLQTQLLELLERFDLTACMFDARRTELAGGVALSPKHALDCLDDPLRTRRFIVGVYQALKMLESRFNGQKIEVLYAGCGPVAPLILPLLGAFRGRHFALTLVDVNTASTGCLSALIPYLGFSDMAIEVKCADAITYRHPTTLHLAITETMDKGLTKEPQIRVMQNLSEQLMSGGVLIPERISLFVEQTTFASLPYFIPGNQSALHTTAQSNGILLFELDKTLAAAPAFEYRSEWLERAQHEDIVLTAELNIFADVALMQGQSQISNPYLLCADDKSKSGRFQLVLNTEHCPEWQVFTQ